MEDTKKIITKAVYGNRIQTFRTVVRIPVREMEKVKSILGGAINGAKILSTSMEEDDYKGIKVRANVEFEIHIWYWSDNDTKVYKVNSESSDIIEIGKQGPEQFRNVNANVWMKGKPKYINAEIVSEKNGDQVAVQIEYVLEAELIGETLLNIKVFNDSESLELTNEVMGMTNKPMEKTNKMEIKYLQNL